MSFIKRNYFEAKGLLIIVHLVLYDFSTINFKENVFIDQVSKYSAVHNISKLVIRCLPDLSEVIPNFIKSMASFATPVLA